VFDLNRPIGVGKFERIGQIIQLKNGQICQFGDRLGRALRPPDWIKSKAATDPQLK
jgi:hypothetical protein